MQEIRHITVGMDAGELAGPAITAALHLAPVLVVATVDVVHAVHPNKLGMTSREAEDYLRRQTRIVAAARADRLVYLERILAAVPESKLRADQILDVQFGKPAPLLLQHAEARGDTLLVLGPHRHRALVDFGGTTREILSAATSPIWIQPCPWSPVRRILAAIDLAEGSASVAAMAIHLATQLGAKLTLLHAFERPQMAYPGLDPQVLIDADRERAEQAFAAFTTTLPESREALQTTFVAGPPAPSILDAGKDSDLIIIGSHGHSMFSQVMLGSEAYQVVKQTRVPVVVVPQRTPARLGAGNTV